MTHDENSSLLLDILLKDDADQYHGMQRIDPTEIQIFDQKSFNCLINLAHQHGLDAFVMRMLMSMNLMDKLSPACKHRLDQYSHLHLCNLSLQREALRELVVRFKAQTCRFVVIKGGALMHSIYKQTNDRQFNDLDILVAPRDIELAQSMLKELGYKQAPVRSKAELKYGELSHPHVAPFKKNGVTIELHTRLLPVELVDFSGKILLSAYTEENHECCVPVPEENLHLIYLMAHIYKHAQSNQIQFRLFRDIALLAGSENDKWNALIESSQQFNLLHQVLWVYHWTCVLYDWEGQPSDPPLNPSRSGGEGWIRTLAPFHLLPDISSKFDWMMGLVFPPWKYQVYYYPHKTFIGRVLLYPARIVKAIYRLLELGIHSLEIGHRLRKIRLHIRNSRLC